MGVQTLAVAALLVSALALAAGVVLLLRFGMLARRSEGPLEPALRHLDQGLRDELLRSRGIAAEDARSLREEVAGAVVRLGDSLQRTVEGRLEAMRADNAAKLESIRATVDEKLHKTLEERLGASFKLVSNHLEQVFKSVGEMQSLAAGVGDLKRVLTNVKARGTWGEISLGGVLEQALTAEQYERNVEIRPGSNQRVEFAVRLPGADGDGPLWLPIDAKFPTEDYERLGDAAERADGAGVEIAGKAIETRIRLAARDICAKYVAPPYSTDFALLYLPTEGLYAEIVRRPGLVDTLQRDWRVVVAGPTTLLALLNSLRMGFRSLAIQKRSSEVWHLLRAVKTEFGRYGEVLDKVQKKLSEASNTIENVAVRRRQIDRKLAQIETLPEPEALVLLGLDGPDAAPAED
jgi:DNA recombination protein RmuC